MKIGILTFHRADNYGALLQAYALQSKLNAMGNETEIIDYRCMAIENDYFYKIIPPIRKNVFAWCNCFIKNTYVVPKKRIKAEKCESFRINYLNLSESVAKSEDRSNVEKKYDLIITGSDQIWSTKLTHGKDDWYCFKKSEDSCKVVSYGASVGNLNEFISRFELFKSDLSKYSYISTREEESKKFLQEMLKRDIYKVLDPTLIVDHDIWYNLAQNTEINIQEKYLLYYDVEENKNAQEIAVNIAKTKKLKIVHFSDSINMLRMGIYVQQAGPCDFLSLIKNAEYVVTSSFHATVFSIVFNVPFITIPHPKTGARVRSLLGDLRLESRICNIFNEFDDVSIDSEGNGNTYKIINEWAKEAENYLMKCIYGGS